VVDARLIFKPALELLASGIILFHNHPSGNLKPSKQDLELTKKLVSGARNIDMNILDHLIISERGYLSFKDEGYL
jgi:DNA repair protein RadC